MPGPLPSLLNELRRRSLRMASVVEDILSEACGSVFDTDATRAALVIERDREVDAAEVEVESEVIRLLALFQPVGLDLRVLCTILKVNNNLERVADCAVNIAERARYLQAQPLALQHERLRRLCTLVRKTLRDAIQAYGTDDAEAARLVIAEEPNVDRLYGQVVREVVAAANDAEGEVAPHLDLMSVSKNLERIADHATNVAEDVIFLATGEIVRHQRSVRAAKA